MATKVLRPQDLLGERFRVRPTSFYRRRNFTANGNFSDVIDNRKQQRKTSPKHDGRRFNAAAAEEASRSSLGGGVHDPRRRTENGGVSMRKVTLLRRGESLSSIASKMTGESPNSTQIQKPVDDLAVINKPKKIVTNQIRLAAPPSDVYAGSAFFSSPSPRSVPLPSFFSKKDSNDCQIKPIEDGATRDLRRLLRLE